MVCVSVHRLQINRLHISWFCSFVNNKSVAWDCSHLTCGLLKVTLSACGIALFAMDILVTLKAHLMKTVAKNNL